MMEERLHGNRYSLAAANGSAALKYKIFRFISSVALSAILLLFLSFYWVFKNPQWISFKVLDLSFLTLLFLSFCGLLHLIIYDNHKVGKDELIYVTLLCLVPLPGFVSNEIFQAGPAYDWSARIDPDLASTSRDTIFGFKQYIYTGIVFILASRFIALNITRKQFTYVILIAGFIHVTWGVAQFIWPVFPDVLNMLPINVGDACANQRGYCFSVIRATGLTPNPFYFGWLVLVVFLVLLVRKYTSFSFFFYITSYLSLTRTFILASIPIIIKLLSKHKYLVTLFVPIVMLALYASLEDIYSIIELRSNSDGSRESRIAGNTLVLQELFAGNIFGVGWLNGYYTDSTVAAILLKSGLLGVVFYIAAWAIFYWKLYFYSSKDTYIVFFAALFFISSFLISSVESLPGSFILLVFYWQQKQRYLSRQLLGPPCTKG